MSPKLWSDEDRLFIPRMGGWTINFKHIARKFGWVKARPISELARSAESAAEASDAPKTAEDRLADAVERSRFEDS